MSTNPQTRRAPAREGPGAPRRLTITVHGNPAPQGSKRHVGNGIMVESSKAARPWREDVRQAALQALGCQFNLEYTASGIQHAHMLGPDDPRTCCEPALDGPLAVWMVFSFRRPKSHYGTGRNADVVKPSAPAYPAGPPDLSKLARATEDALQSAGAITDDARIVQYRRLAKVYGDDALPSPGAVIRVWEVT